MFSKMQAVRAAGLAGLGVLGFSALPALAPAGVAQEKEEERRIWRGPFRADMDGWGGRPMLGVILTGGGDDGVLVADVLEDSPAAKAGIVEGDLILSVNGHDLSEPLGADDERDLDTDRSRPEGRLRALVSRTPEGEPVTLVVQRDGEEVTFGVVPEVLPVYAAWWPDSDRLEERIRELSDWWSDESQREETLERIRELTERFRDQERPYEWDLSGWVPPGSLRIFADTLLAGPGRLRWSGFRGAHGLDLVELNPGLGAYFGTTKGVLVADVEDESSLGLRAGDVVVAVDGRTIDDIDEMHRVLGSYRSDEEISLRIFRNGAETTVTGIIG